MSTTLLPNDALVLASLNPAQWDVTSTRACTGCAGADLKFSFTGTTLAAGVDVSLLSGYGAGYYPTLKHRIDGGSWTRTQLTSGQTSLNFTPSPLSDATHTFELIADGFDESSNSKLWDSTAAGFCGLKLTGLTVDTGKTIVPTVRPLRNLVVLSDSIPAGAVALGEVTGGNYSLVASASLSWAALYAAARGYNLINISYPSIGLVAASVQGVPAVPTSFASVLSGVTRTWPTVAECIIPLGTNDTGSSDATVTAALEALLTTARTAFGSACRLRVLPAPGGYKASAVAAAVTNRLASLPADLCAYYDTATASAAIVAANSYEGSPIHPSAAGHTLLAQLYRGAMPAFAGTLSVTSLTATNLVLP